MRKKTAKDDAVLGRLPRVFDYLDFRKFLDKYQRERQIVDKEFTRSYICKLFISFQW